MKLNRFQVKINLKSEDLAWNLVNLRIYHRFKDFSMNYGNWANKTLWIYECNDQTFRTIIRKKKLTKTQESYMVHLSTDSHFCKSQHVRWKEIVQTSCWRPDIECADEDENLWYSDKSDKSMDFRNPWNLRIYPRIYMETQGCKPQTLRISWWMW